MANIIIRFVTDSDPISAAIRQETWSSFSHVEFVTDEGLALGAKAIGGVALRPLNYAQFTNEERYNLAVTDQKKAIIMAYAMEQLGKPYDFSDIAGIVMHRDWRCDDKWICSELVAASFEKANFPLLNAPSEIVNRITPGDLYMSPYLIGNRIWPI